MLGCVRAAGAAGGSYTRLHALSPLYERFVIILSVYFVPCYLSTLYTEDL